MYVALPQLRYTKSSLHINLIVELIIRCTGLQFNSFKEEYPIGANLHENFYANLETCMNKCFVSFSAFIGFGLLCKLHETQTVGSLIYANK